MVTAQPPTSRSRYPIGVLVIVVITALRCVTLVAGLAELNGAQVVDWLGAGSPVPQPEPGSDEAIIAAILLVALLVASVLVVVGLLARRSWAWVMAIVSSGVILAIDLGWWWSGQPRDLSTALNVVAVFYLNQQDVRIALRSRPADKP